MLLSLALVLQACGGGDPSAGAEPKAPTTATTARAKPAAATPSRDCGGELNGLLASMDALRRKLAAGVSYDQYLHEIRGLTSTYDGIEADRVALGCLLASGTPAERALNRYIGAANTWGDCLASVSCGTESVEPKLQRRWALASDLLSSAQTGLHAGEGRQN
jgi:hypothetical protein